ncbi:MAG: hypothetical protein AUH81_02460 [Candidatus Rokubacteria bacterium 13_1_40CM_4_69_5]|nr:MAG: hypothetical protein AUH81_02460 [Candidatus Rokubacteria bacterium 13_1_40CM_4_69_5]
MVIVYSDLPMISRMRSRRAPSRTSPRSTSGSSSKRIPTRSGSTLAADLPSAIMRRPQLGSCPLSAVFTRNELATLRAASRASLPVVAPRTAMVTSFVAPSPSLTSIRASRAVSASRPRANCRRPRPPVSSGAFSARPLASTATVSLVD